MPRRNTSAPARKARRKYQSMTDPMVRAQNECWCGKPRDHTWPGSNLGEPHPMR